MVAHILAQTPKWVFVIFFVLLGYGYLQVKTRALSSTRVIMLPIIMTLLSVGGVFSSFGAHAVPLAAWAVGFAAAIGINQVIRAPAGVRYDAATRRFTMPGSWTPLLLMMTIFFAKYAVGASMALDPEILTATGFETALGVLFGALSGTFFARFLRIWGARNTGPALEAREPSQDGSRLHVPS